MLGSDPILQLDNVEILKRNADAVARINSHTFTAGDAETAIKRQTLGEEHDPEVAHAALRPEYGSTYWDCVRTVACIAIRRALQPTNMEALNQVNRSK